MRQGLINKAATVFKRGTFKIAGSIALLLLKSLMPTAVFQAMEPHSELRISRKSIYIQQCMMTLKGIVYPGIGTNCK